jgi:peptidoglycan/LPS O-acetylase OafA/YrhL
VISGFLVTRSASTRSISGYLAARALRILPALAVVVLVTVFFIGPLLTRMTLKEYFSENLLHPGTINGSLWTLRLQCAFYVILLGLVIMRLFGQQIGLLITAAVVAAFFYCVYHLKYGWNNEGPVFWQGIGVYSTLKFGSAFMLGGALWIYRHDIPLSPWSAFLCGLALITGAGSPASTVLYVLCVPYLVIYLALGLPISLPLSEKIGDLSYGVYLMAFPIQQAVITFLGNHSPILVSVIATAIVLPLAVLSWRFIEKPSLDFKTTGLPISSAALEHSALPVSPQQRNIARIVFVGHFIAGALSRIKSGLGQRPA